MTHELVYTGFISLDGVADSPGGPEEGHRSGGWVMNTEPTADSFSLTADEFADTTALMFGRRSYEAFAPVWRGSEDLAVYRDLPKIVVSTTLTQADLVDGFGPTTLLGSTEDVAALKQSDGGAIYIHGSLELARRLSDADLIDRYNLLMFPVILGSGKSLFSRGDRDAQRLNLRDSATYANGVTKLIYEVVR